MSGTLVLMAHTDGNVVIEYHQHSGVRTAVDGETVLMVCQHIYLDGTECDFRWDARHVNLPGAGSRLTTAEAIRAHITKMVDAAAFGALPAAVEATAQNMRERHRLQAEGHAPEIAGPDGLGYGRCVSCSELWPCTTWRNK